MSRLRMFLGRLVAFAGLCLSVVGIWIALGRDEAEIYGRHMGNALANPPRRNP